MIVSSNELHMPVVMLQHCMCKLTCPICADWILAFINTPWGGDGFGPLDFTLLDRHHGNIEAWRSLITEIHRREMYVILDNTMATLVSLH